MTFRFIKCPEWLKIGSRLLFREGRTKGVGKIVKLYTREEEANLAIEEMTAHADASASTSVKQIK